MNAVESWRTIDDHSLMALAATTVGPRLAGGAIAGREDCGSRAQSHQAAWHNLIEETLDAWQRDTRDLDDEGIRPPSVDTIELARRLARRLCECSSPPPTGIIPNGSGGITFERREVGWLETFRILADHTIELLVFEDCQLVSRRAILADQL